MGKTTVTAIVNQKGGVGKTVTTENLGIGLANEGKRVLLVDCDPQASLTISLGHPQPDELPVTLTEMLRGKRGLCGFAAVIGRRDTEYTAYASGI